MIENFETNEIAYSPRDSYNSYTTIVFALESEILSNLF